MKLSNHINGTTKIISGDPEHIKKQIVNHIPDCPSCTSRKVGMIGVKKYFCRDCYIEFNSDSKIIYSYTGREKVTSI